MSAKESDTANEKYLEFLAFLKARETDDKTKVTHTRVGVLKNTKGKYQIQNHNQS